MDAQVQKQHLDLAAMKGGFVEPVIGAQCVFRAVMDAMAMPGKIVDLAADVTPPAPLSGTVGAILASLADPDTPLWLDDMLAASDDIRQWITFHSGAPFANEHSEATFAIVSDPLNMPPLEVFAQGLQDYPDRSTTLILQLDSIEAGDEWQLSGPGIKGTSSLAVSPIPANFTVQWASNNQRFPRGVDVILAGPDSVACLPRTTRLLPRSANSEGM